MIKRTYKIIQFAVIPLLFFLVGCSNLKPATPGNPAYAPTYPTVKPPAQSEDGAIYQPGYSVSLFRDRTAQRVGDILTIRLEETTSAKKNADTKTNKEAEAVISNPTLFGKAVNFGNNRNLDFRFKSKSDFKGSGQSNQSNNLQGYITVTVARVLSNGNLVIQGETWISLNQGREYVRLSGLVRQDDIDADNAVSSRRVANARITYSGTGSLAEANAQGWLQRFFNKFWPF